MTGGRAWLWRVIGGAFVLTALWFVVSGMADDWPSVLEAARSYTVASLLASFAAAMAGLAATAMAWRGLLAGLGHRLPLVVAATVFFTSQLGKYVPGSVWPYLAQARLGAQRGVPGSRAAQAGVTFVLLHLLTGAVVGLPRLVFGAGLDARFAFALLIVPVVLVVVHPAVTSRLTVLLARLTKVSVQPASPTWGSLAGAASWLLVAWALYGLSLAALVAPLEPLTPGVWVQLTSAYALAWSVGFVAAAALVVMAPAGLGFREAALVATLSGVVAAGPAGLVALLSRVVMTVGDVVWAGTAALVSRVGAGSAGETHRQPDRESAAGAVVGDVDGAVVRGHDPGDDGQSDAAADVR
jgi:uncharacterized membrane protein YbhN (UPF0104 family)